MRRGGTKTQRGPDRDQNQPAPAPLTSRFGANAIYLLVASAMVGAALANPARYADPKTVVTKALPSPQLPADGPGALSSPTSSSTVKERDPVAPFRGAPVPYLANGSQSVLRHKYACDPHATAQWRSTYDDPGIKKVLPADKLFRKRLLFLGNSHVRQLYIAFVSTFSAFITNVTRNRIERVVPFEYEIEGYTNVFNVSFAFQSEAVVVYNSWMFYQPNVSKLEKFVGRPFAEFDVVVLGYVNPSSHCRAVLEGCPNDIQTNFSGIVSHFREDAELLLVNMFGRSKNYRGYSPNNTDTDTRFMSFRDNVRRNHSFVDISRVPFCSIKSCEDQGGHQCNNPGPPNLAAWHLIDCMTPSSNETNCRKVEHSRGEKAPIDSLGFIT